jgi:hypothetical protein
MNAHPEKLHKGKAVMMKLFINNYCQPDPAASPKAWMGACHYGGSRFIALDTPLCPRFMPRPWAFFRNTYLLHDIGAASPVAPDFSITTAASDACEFRSPTSSRGDNGVVGLTPWHSVRAPLRSHVPLAGRVMSAVYPPSCGASIGDAPRFMGVR